jgi:hypothetical protein
MLSFTHRCHSFRWKPNLCTVACPLKAGIVNHKRRPLLGYGTTNTKSAQRCYLLGPCKGCVWRIKIDEESHPVRVVRGDKSKPRAQGYNWATLFLGDIGKGTWPSSLGSLRWDSKVWLTGVARLGPLSDCIANYWLVRSSKRAPYIKIEQLSD